MNGLIERIAAAIRMSDGDHTMGASELADEIAHLVPEIQLAEDVTQQRMRNHARWGERSIEGMPPDYPGWLETLVEEVGEVSRAKQTSDRAKMRAELIDTLAVCWMWIDAIDEEPEELKPRTHDERRAYESAWDERVEAGWERDGKPEPTQQRGGYPGESIIGSRKPSA